MTYCVAMCLSDGLVFASDSRTNAGVDHIATFKKLHVFHQDGERVMVLQSAGNLATTQSVISLLSARIRTQQEPNLMQVTSLYDAAMLIDSAVKAAGGAGNPDTLREAIKKADFTSLRGKFKFNTNGYPIQDFYLVKVAKRADGKFQTEIAQKVFSDYADPHAKACALK